jgi:hypothetical protein
MLGILAIRAATVCVKVLEQITRDHSWLQEQIDAGLITPQQAALSSSRNLRPARWAWKKTCWSKSRISEWGDCT